MTENVGLGASEVSSVIPREVQFATLGTCFGVVVSLLVQWALYQYWIWMAIRRFRRDIDNLRRHIRASLRSLEGIEPRPRYFIAARLRFCSFLDGMASMQDLDWLTRSHASRRILPTLFAIRNSDIFVGEIAARVDAMSEVELADALQEAKRNLQILETGVARLGFATLPTDPVLGDGITAPHVEQHGGFVAAKYCVWAGSTHVNPNVRGS